MDSIIRAVAVYLFLLLLFRISGKRTLAEVTTFDLVLTLIISEAIQQALIGTDNSLTNGLLVVMTLVAVDMLISMLKLRFARLDRILEGVPVTIFDDGRFNRETLQGLDRFEDLHRAVIEKTGRITIIPTQPK